MKYKLELHKYAPELNKLHCNGIALDTPNVTTVSDAKRLLGFTKCNGFRKWCKIVVSVPNKPSFCRVVGGYFNHYSQLSIVMRNLKERHNIQGTVIKIESIKGVYHV